MTPEQFRQARELFRGACDLPPDRRLQFLASKCADATVRAAVDRWLAEDVRTQSLDEGPDVAPLLADLARKRSFAAPRTPGTPPKRSDGTQAAPGDARFLPGAMLGNRFRIISLLGRGGMGEVYRADDLTLGETVALKFLPEGLDPNGEVVRRFVTEVRIARQVTHPNVCRVHDVGKVDGQHFLSMEYVDGEDLASLLRRIGRLPDDKAVQVAVQITAGLQAAHERGILHRDLKPANVMIDGRGQVKLTDFGLADVEAAIRPSDIRSGTPTYMAPEQIAGEAVTARSDLFALGLVLHEIFTGKRAFAGTSAAELTPQYAKGLETTPSGHLKSLDRNVELAIMRCLALDPRDRPSSAAEVGAMLPASDAMLAALRAGETPSPNMVAAAGSKGLAPIPVLLGLLAVVCVAIVGSILLADRIWLMPQVAPPRSPTRLAENAAEVIAGLRKKELLPVAGRPAEDVAFGFFAVRRFLDFRQRNPEFRASHPLNAARPPALLFWYLESPQPIHAVPRGVNISPISASNPDRDLPGMVSLLLDPNGHLVRLTAIPTRFDQTADGTASSVAPDWAVLFSQANLDLASFTEAAPVWAPGVASDRRVAWIREKTPADDFELRVEAASLGSRVVAFAVLMPWDVPSDGTRPGGDLWDRAAPFMRTALVVLFYVGGVFLAWRNVRRKRGDVAGALRVFSFVFLMAILYWFVAVSRFPSGSGDLLDQSERAVAVVLFWSTINGVAYLAIEPWVRRRAPERMVAWSRALAGRWRDPLVGRDLLIGVAAGSGLAVLMNTLDVVGRSALGLPDPAPLVGAFPMVEPRMAIGSLFFTSMHCFTNTASCLLLVLLVKVVVQKLWLAIAVSMCVALVMFTPRGGDLPAWDMAETGIVAVGFLLFLFRYGLIAGMVGDFAFLLVQNRPGGSDVTAWYAFPATSGFVVLAALAVFGFVIALGGRRVIGDEVLER